MVLVHRLPTYLQDNTKQNCSSGVPYTETKTCPYVKKAIETPEGLVEIRTIAKPDEIKMGGRGWVCATQRQSEIEMKTTEFHLKMRKLTTQRG